MSVATLIIIRLNVIIPNSLAIGYANIIRQAPNSMFPWTILASPRTNRFRYLSSECSPKTPLPPEIDTLSLTRGALGVNSNFNNHGNN